MDRAVHQFKEEMCSCSEMGVGVGVGVAGVSKRRRRPWLRGCSNVSWAVLLLAAFACLLMQCVVAVGAEGADREGRCPPLKQWGVCPPGRARCARDRDCARSSDKCCASACGRTCVKPQYSGCEQVRREASRRARALAPPLAANVLVPRCDQSGGFDPVQCRQGDASCWCVDQSGAEVAGTRADTRQEVNCTAPSSRCPAPTCRMLCQHGFVLDSEGCARCECRDPCVGVACPGNTACQLIKSVCSDPPCPPLASCLKAPRSLRNVCPLGQPLSVQGSARPFLCGTAPGRPGCPPMFSCSVEPRHEYGVCCPVGRLLSKPGTCPSPNDAPDSPDDRAVAADDDLACHAECDADLECPHMEKCCLSDSCGMHCVQPANVTECHVARALSDLLAASEREGRGYAPQCLADGSFAPRQCSRNGLVCWCVDPSSGHKTRGSMGAAADVSCSALPSAAVAAAGRSLEGCDRQLCAAVCQYGFRADADGCPGCACATPCEGFACPQGSECQAQADHDHDCQGSLCAARPECVPVSQPADSMDLTAEAMDPQEMSDPMAESMEPAESANPTAESMEEDVTMCRYLRDFDAKMEGTRADMKLALPPPRCQADGTFSARQCAGADCWCVDTFGTEIPHSRNVTECSELRAQLACPEPQCRLGCDYGFVLDPDTRCATCACTDPCAAVSCAPAHACVAVDVNCAQGLCPPVPVCLAVKEGQCPFVSPLADASCEFACAADAACDADMKCCPNGCGTGCVAPLRLTACQLQREQLSRAAADLGIRGRRASLPRCREADGAFEAVQCSDDPNGTCWCVDDVGREVAGTRTPAPKHPDCSASSSRCPDVRCVAPCDAGFALDGAGCPTCACADPCAGVACALGEACLMMPLPCGKAPCPVVPTCLPANNQPCQAGSQPLRRNGSLELLRCGPGSHGQCPSSHKCQLSPLGDLPVCCPKPRSVCVEPANERPCVGPSETRFRFNASSNRCEETRFCGSGGLNSFESERDCRSVCPVLSQCERVRERNRLRGTAFSPACDSETGAWQAVQCLPSVDVCWCVTPQGNALKGTVAKGTALSCSFRTARKRVAPSVALGNGIDPDMDVLEQLLSRMTLWEEEPVPAAGQSEASARSFDQSDASARSFDQSDASARSFDQSDASARSFDQSDASARSFDQSEASPRNTVQSEPVPRKAVVQSKGVSRCLAMRGKMAAGSGGGASYVVACDADGRFTPVQCYQHRPECWCVDEAGNQLPDSATFPRGASICLPTPIEAVEVRLGFAAPLGLRSSAAHELRGQVRSLLTRLDARLRDDLVTVETDPEGLVVSFAVVGGNKVDVAYQLEEMVISESLSLAVSASGRLTADVTASRFTHRLASSPLATRVIALEHREVVMETAPAAQRYQAAILVLSVASATVICVLVLLVMLYRRKVSQASAAEMSKLSALDQRFLDSEQPIYVVSLPTDKPTTGQDIQPMAGLRL